jgi:DNA-binding response OmpR family regulator
MIRRSLLIVTADRARGWDLGEQLDADGHDIHLTDDRPGAIAKLSTHAIDVVILGELERPADAPALLRELRGGQLHPRVHPGQPVITIWGADDLSALRAYDAGSDHHLPAVTGYLVVRAVVDVVARRTLEPVTREQLQVGPLHIDVAAHTVDVDDGTAVALTRREFELLRRLAGDPSRVFAKEELVHAVWGRRDAVSPRTIDSHVCRLREKLAAAGADGQLQNSWGVGYRLAPRIEP